jgi:hypothetical protein
MCWAYLLNLLLGNPVGMTGRTERQYFAATLFPLVGAWVVLYGGWLILRYAAFSTKEIIQRQWERDSN